MPGAQNTKRMVEIVTWESGFSQDFVESRYEVKIVSTDFVTRTETSSMPIQPGGSAGSRSWEMAVLSSESTCDKSLKGEKGNVGET